MTYGFVTKVAMTPAHVTDAAALRSVCPDSGMVFADKAYCTKQAQQALKAKGCVSGVIKKNNMTGKDFRRDKWLTRVRMPYEGICSLFQKRARYRTIKKVQYQGFMEAIAINLKRWIKLEFELLPTVQGSLCPISPN